MEKKRRQLFGFYEQVNNINCALNVPTCNNKFVNCFRLMQSVVSSIYCNDLSIPLKKLASERQQAQRNTNEKLCCMSIYREILFLTCKAVGRNNTDLNAFDKQYLIAFGRQERNIICSPQDRPLNINSIYCRQYFKPLQLP